MAKTNFIQERTNAYSLVLSVAGKHPFFITYTYWNHFELTYSGYFEQYTCCLRLKDAYK